MRSADDHHVADRTGIALGQFHGAGGCPDAADAAAQDDPAIGGPDVNLLFRQDLGQTFLEFRDVRRDLHIDIGDQAAVRAQKGQGRAPGRLAQHIDRPVGERRDIGNARIGDRQFREGFIRFHHDRAVDGNFDAVRCRATHDFQGALRHDGRRKRRAHRQANQARCKQVGKFHVILPL